MVRPFLYDVIFVGGGLANGLAAYRLQQYRPDLRFLIFEKGDQLGGNHTWSFHQKDLDTRQRAWLSPFFSKTWGGYEVQFPQFSRTIYSSYFSIQSTKFHELLTKKLGSWIRFNSTVSKLSSNSVTLESGKTYKARCVVDGRGWVPDPAIPVGYQKFYGLDITLSEPHSRTLPLLMDVRETQKDGYRFFYILPWSSNSLLVEDTRYSDSPDVEDDKFRNDIMAYVEKQGWTIQSVSRQERGVLPIPLSGKLNFGGQNIPFSGSRAGLFHSTTGYSLPEAVRFSEAFASFGCYEAEAITKWARSYAERHWEKESFHRFLNRMLFQAAEPEDRFKVLQKFYRFSEGTIGRFYSGQLNSFDHLRILSGKPPVPVSKALRCFF